MSSFLILSFSHTYSAAAYSKLNNHTFALEDCQRSIEIDPDYSKAYGRMGLAYASLSDQKRAKESYEKAIELDPHNESYRNNLRIAEDRIQEQQVWCLSFFYSNYN